MMFSDFFPQKNHKKTRQELFVQSGFFSFISNLPEIFMTIIW